MPATSILERTTAASEESQCFVLPNISWKQYEALLTAFGDRYLRHTYYQGELEIVSPSRNHEWVKTLLGDFVAILCRILRVPRQGIGSTTMHHKAWKGGMEADEGFYIGEKSLKRARGRMTFDPDVDPPPDLVIEIDVSRSSEDRMKMYAAMQVPEVWRFRGGEVAIHRLGRRAYRQSARSKLFPFLTASDLTRFLESRTEQDDTELEQAFEDWVRERTSNDDQ